MPINSAQFPRFVLPILRREWDMKLREVASPVMSLFGTEVSTASEEYSQGVGEFSEVPEVNSFDAEGAPNSIAFDQINPLYEKTFQHREYARGVAIERKLFDDDQRGRIRRKVQNFGAAFGMTRAKHAASVFNYAFETTDNLGRATTGGDSVALCTASHPLSPDQSGTTKSNRGTTALSYNAIVSTLQLGKRVVDDRGEPMPVFYDTLVVPIELEATAYEITAALNKPTGTAAQNEANFVGSEGMKTLVDPYLTDSNNWFMVDSRMANMHLLWFNRVLPEFDLDVSNSNKLVTVYSGYMRHSYGWDDWRFIYGHQVTGGSA